MGQSQKLILSFLNFKSNNIPVPIWSRTVKQIERRGVEHLAIIDNILLTAPILEHLFVIK